MAVEKIVAEDGTELNILAALFEVKLASSKKGGERKEQIILRTNCGNYGTLTILCCGGCASDQFQKSGR